MEKPPYRQSALSVAVEVGILPQLARFLKEQENMVDIRIESQSFCIGRWHFPPFTLRCGECVTLCLPREASHDEDRIIGCLTGRETVPGLNVSSNILFVKPASSPSGWRRWFQNPSAFYLAAEKHDALGRCDLVLFARTQNG